MTPVKKSCFAGVFAVAMIFITPTTSVFADLWSTAYYAGWMQSQVPAARVDFSAVTHVIHFSIVPNNNGSLNSTVHSLFPTNSADLLARAHAAGRKVLVSVGGADTQTAFQSATAPSNAPSFVSNLVHSPPRAAMTALTSIGNHSTPLTHRSSPTSSGICVSLSTKSSHARFSPPPPRHSLLCSLL